jgi:phosphatidylserine/phosphatidylglycerophosphate/cardiolipin synthase-like enzyme
MNDFLAYDARRPPAMTAAPLLRPGATCWRVEQAARVAILIDSAAYFAAARAAMLRARHSILLLGWDFDLRTPLCPAGPRSSDSDISAIGPFLKDLAARRPGLSVRVLIWDMPAIIAAGRDLSTRQTLDWFRDSGVDIRLDPSPAGTCHHQKLLVIDGTLAFCSGGDFAIDRWDTTGHPDHDPRRIMPSGEEHAPRHEVTMLVDGPPAAALAELAHERWFGATGQAPSPSPPDDTADPWPDGLTPHWTDAPIGIARTGPSWLGQPGIHEAEALHLAAIAAARRFIYLENQYFASSRMAEALATRLAEPDGPEVVLVVSGRSPSYFDRLTMDAPRNALIDRLKKSFGPRRFRAYAPHTHGGRIVTVHSKVAIIDDRLVRVGSANLNNRSGGHDTECDLVLEAPRGTAGERAESAITTFRRRLIGHYMDMDMQRAAGILAEREHGGLIAAIEALQAGVPADSRRLRPLQPNAGPIASLMAMFHLGDPHGPGDAWKPWRRVRPRRAE